MSEYIPEDWDYDYESEDELVLTYYRYDGLRDQENNRIYEESQMFVSSSNVDMYVSYYFNHSEVATWKGYGFKLSNPETGDETEWYYPNHEAIV